jgi:predicted nucleic acid-binding protein
MMLQYPSATAQPGVQLPYLPITASTATNFMSGKVFLDTNLWVYLNCADPKAATVRKLVENHSSVIIVSAQVLGELYNVLTRKGLADKDAAREIVNDLQQSFHVAPISSATVTLAMAINKRNAFTYWDSLIVAAALENGCKTLFSEDLHHGQLIDKKLTIKNPFN